MSKKVEQRKAEQKKVEQKFENKENREIPQKLKDFRKKWEKIIYFSNDTKKKVIDAVNKIPHRATIESDGSMLVEFELWWKAYKTLNVNLAEHSDDVYLSPFNYNWQKNYEVKLWWMIWDNTGERKNRKLAKYVEKEKDDRKMEIPTVEFQMNLINKLWDYAGLTEESDKIAMWMYLTWNYGFFWLSMWDSEHSKSQENSRPALLSSDTSRTLNYYSFDNYGASLYLITYGSQNVKDVMKEMKA